MKIQLNDSTRFTPPHPGMAFRQALEAATIAYGGRVEDLPALVGEIERASASACAAGMRGSAFDAAIADYVSAHGWHGLYPLPETTLANVLLAASRGFNRGWSRLG